jgi:hypothetical protein
MNELRTIWNDIRNRNFLESYIVLAVGAVILVADIFGAIDPPVMNEVILAVLSAIVYLIVLERREYQRMSAQRDRDIEGITVFHPNRDSLLPLDRILRKAKKELILYAVQHSYVIHQCLGLLEEKAEAGCKIKILMMAPRSVDGEVNPNVMESASHRRYAGLLEQIESSAKSFQSWLGSLSASARQMVEIRTYLECPVATYTFIDKDETSGFVQVELLLYGIHVHDMPHYIVTKKDDGRFFDTHCESFDRLWSRSQVLPPLGEENHAVTSG